MRGKRSVALFIALLVALLVRQRTHADTLRALGDANADGVVTAADAARLLRGETQEEACDLTQNGALDDVDARAALFVACGLIPDAVKFAERVASGLCHERLFDRFCYTGVKNDGAGNYQSQNVAVSCARGEAYESNYILVDVYVQDIMCFSTAFSSGAFMGSIQSVPEMFQDSGAILAVNGDFYTQRLYGPIVRNGIVYASYISRDWDTAILRTNGELVTYDYGKLNADDPALENAYQTWIFGPALLDETGAAKETFRSAVTPENPRTAIGYYEPGHYGILVADGRSETSRGLTMRELSLLCQTLGFSAAYNLDGGQSSVLIAQGGVLNEPFKGGRRISDAILIRDLPTTDD